MSGGMEQRFLDQIVANIEDDIPRLIYADWLMENGQEERSEFIHVQVARARLPAWDASQVKLRIREQELLNQYGERWLAELPVVEGAKWEGFRRGIVAEVSFRSYEAMRAKAHECRALAPVEAVTVHWPRRNEPQKATKPIAELRELTLTGRPYDEETEWLAESPQLATLRTLNVMGLDVNDLNRLTASPHLGGLRSLRLSSNGVGTAGVQALIQSPTLTALEVLDLSGPGYYDQYYDDPIINDIGMAALAGWHGLANVRTLTLSGSDVRPAGLRALLRSPHAVSLKRLSLRGGRLDGPAMAEFESARPGLKLESLNIGENIIQDLGVGTLAVAPCLGELKSLRIDRCEITQTGARVFAQKAVFLDGLRCLDLSHNRLGPEGLEPLLERGPQTLHTLRLRDSDIADAGVELLAKSPASNTIQDLDLRNNRLESAAVRALGATEHLREVVMLRLKENPLYAHDTANLVASPLGQRLLALDLANLPTGSSQRSSAADDFTFDGDGQRWNYDDENVD